MNSNTTVQTFVNDELGQIRTLVIDGEPYFVGKDVAVILGYARPENAIAAHIDSEDKTTTLIQGIGTNYKSMTTIINESGLYSLIFSSKLPSAKGFKRWVTSEVLPSLRKSGFYSIVGTDDTTEIFDEEKHTNEATAHDYLKVAQIVASCKSDRLPMVLRILESGGWNIARPQDFIPHDAVDTTDAGTRILTTAKKLGSAFQSFRR